MLKLPTTYKNNNSDINLIEKIHIFKKTLAIQSFILLARPKDNVYKSEIAKKKFIQDLDLIIEKGLLMMRDFKLTRLWGKMKIMKIPVCIFLVPKV